MGAQSVELSAGVVELLSRSDQPVEKTAVEFIVLELYRRHVISAGRAAELLGTDDFTFIQHASSLGIPYFDMTGEELREELERVRVLWPGT